MSNLTRPLPTMTLDSAAYWESTREHAMRLQRCSRCQRWRFYPTPVCPSCASNESTWERISGRGSVYSYTEVHKPAASAFAGAEPVVLLLVTLEEGPTMMTDLIGTRDGLRIGMDVVIDYVNLTDEITLPTFRAS